MQTLTAENVLTGKTRELCQAILDQPEYRSLRLRIDAFLADEEAKARYQSISEKGEFLQHKQQRGVALTDEEVQEFEREREIFMSNPVASGFLDAQREAHEMQESVSQLVSKTFELGRVPTAEDLDSGSCGHGCGCH